MLSWAPTRKSLDGRGTSAGTTEKVEIEQLTDGRRHVGGQTLCALAVVS